MSPGSGRLEKDSLIQSQRAVSSGWAFASAEPATSAAIRQLLTAATSRESGVRQVIPSQVRCAAFSQDLSSAKTLPAPTSGRVVVLSSGGGELSPNVS